jgi:putative ATP-dependent endonuclease of the OLD family
LIPGVNLRVANYKSIGEPAQGFTDIYPLNLVVGRNNSGKTALLDLVEFAVDYRNQESHLFTHRHVGCASSPVVTYDITLTQEALDNCCEDNRTWKTPGEADLTSNEFVLRLVGQTVTMSITDRHGVRPWRYPVEFPHKHLQDGIDEAARRIGSPLSGKLVGRIAADRDIQPEQVNTGQPLGANGSGITNLLRSFFVDITLDWDAASSQLLRDLNSIVAPDACFTRIEVKTKGDHKLYEVYLQEEGKGQIPLSASGSGLKTIIAVLTNLLLLPIQTKHPLKDWIFIFEELENNLHPGVLRRLLRYIANKTAEQHCRVFLSTHSTVAIDWLFRRSDVQILHVTHDGLQTSVKRVENTPSIYDALDDLDVRASDMLQANGVVWVEGVSDRIYLERWIQLCCEEVGRQAPLLGVDYVMEEYGGKCLSHYEFGYELDDERERAHCLERLIPALALSRHAFVVMDSDRHTRGQKVRAAKVRVRRAAESSWITKGREIENYIPGSVLETLVGQSVGQFELLTGRIDQGKNKKDFALEVAPLIDATNWKTLDLEQRISRLCGCIESWNTPSCGVASEAP